MLIKQPIITEHSIHLDLLTPLSSAALLKPLLWSALIAIFISYISEDSCTPYGLFAIGIHIKKFTFKVNWL